MGSGDGTTYLENPFVLYSTNGVSATHLIQTYLAMKEKTFADWTTDDLLIVFGLQRINKCEELDIWLNGKAKISDFEYDFLEEIRKSSERYIHAWNGAELRFKVIAPILSLVNYYAPEYFFSDFAERRIEAVLNEIQLEGETSWFVAFGQSNPHIPYFFVHEYKPEKQANSQPLGQLLAMMLAAQVLNKKGIKLPENFSPKIVSNAENPIYGCYIIGGNWSFVVLKELEYCVSPTYYVTKKQDLEGILRILKVQKQMIVKRFIK